LPPPVFPGEPHNVLGQFPLFPDFFPRQVCAAGHPPPHKGPLCPVGPQALRWPPWYLPFPVTTFFSLSWLRSPPPPWTVPVNFPAFFLGLAPSFQVFFPCASFRSGDQGRLHENVSFDTAHFESPASEWAGQGLVFFFPRVCRFGNAPVIFQRWPLPPHSTSYLRSSFPCLLLPLTPFPDPPFFFFEVFGRLSRLLSAHRGILPPLFDSFFLLLLIDTLLCPPPQFFFPLFWVLIFVTFP